MKEALTTGHMLEQDVIAPLEATSMQESLRMVHSQEKESLKEKMGAHTKVNSKTGCLVVKGLCMIQMAITIRASSTMENLMVAGYSLMLPHTNGKAGLNGQWSYGRYIGDGSHPDPRQSNVEKALYVQNRLLKETTSSLFATDPNRINLYFVGIGGDGKQNVFYNEISYIRKLFDESFDTLGRSAILVNNTETVNAIPLATITSIKQILTDVANKNGFRKGYLIFISDKSWLKRTSTGH